MHYIRCSHAPCARLNSIRANGPAREPRHSEALLSYRMYHLCINPHAYQCLSLTQVFIRLVYFVSHTVLGIPSQDRLCSPPSSSVRVVTPFPSSYPFLFFATLLYSFFYLPVSLFRRMNTSRRTLTLASPSASLHRHSSIHTRRGACRCVELSWSCRALLMI